MLTIYRIYLTIVSNICQTCVLVRYFKQVILFRGFVFVFDFLTSYHIVLVIVFYIRFCNNYLCFLLRAKCQRNIITSNFNMFVKSVHCFHLIVSCLLCYFCCIAFWKALEEIVVDVGVISGPILAYFL